MGSRQRGLVATDFTADQGLEVERTPRTNRNVAHLRGVRREGESSVGNNDEKATTAVARIPVPTPEPRPGRFSGTVEAKVWRPQEPVDAAQLP